MVVWSALRPTLLRNVVNSLNKSGPRFMSDHRVFPLQPSRFQWNKFKDLLHFYTMLGLIPVGLVVFYSNVFIGPATLSEIPDDYVPKYYEYYRHPITRAIAKYMLTDPQQDYEKFLHHVFEEEERRRIRLLEKKVKEKMGERHDYQAYYYRPVTGKYLRATKEASDYLESLRGD